MLGAFSLVNVQKADLQQVYQLKQNKLIYYKPCMEEMAAPVPVISASTPSDCFEATLEACRIAIEHMTPVFFLSEGMQMK